MEEGALDRTKTRSNSGGAVVTPITTGRRARHNPNMTHLSMLTTERVAENAPHSDEFHI